MTDQVNADWTELQVTIPAADTDRAGDIAQMVVPYGIYIEDYSHLEEEAMEIAHIDLIDEDLLKKDRTKSIIHVYISPEENPAEAISFLKERFEAVGIENTITAANCAEEDWINNWKKYFKPIPVGKRLLVRPMWEDEYEAGDRVVLHLEPGLAFGTGTHETTRLCMELLEKYVKPGDTMLDMGCGSGILSIISLLLGADSAFAVDIDPNAVDIAYQNAGMNDVDISKYTVKAGDIITNTELQNEIAKNEYDVVVANIVADVIIALAPKAREYMKKGGVFITSGIIEDRVDDVKAALEKCGFEINSIKQRKDWVSIVCKQH